MTPTDPTAAFNRLIAALCSYCAGNGIVVIAARHYPGGHTITIGWGVVECPACGGTGTVKEDQDG